ncbi:MAG TPA: sialidase family protein [Actinomycetota bacterium]
MRRRFLLTASAALVFAGVATTVVVSPSAGATASSRMGPPVTVGTDGNEPLVKVAPDGTLYISALEYLYVSRDQGRTWFRSPGTIYSDPESGGQGVNLNTDSSVAVDPGGRLYFTFDYPYAGVTAVCTSDDRAQHFTCDEKTVPGGTDRMWIAAPTTHQAYLVTNEGLYQTLFFTSSDRGASWTPAGTVTSTLDPNTGELVSSPDGTHLYQAYIDNSTNLTATDDELSGPLAMHVWDPAGGVPQDLPIPLPGGAALPSLAVTPNGTIYVASEGVSGTDATGNPTGKDVRVARSTDGGKTWAVLPALPGTSSGTAAFTAIAAADDGHIGVLYYQTTAGGRADAVNGTWNVMWAETKGAAAARPSWNVRTIETNVHHGAMCTTAGCTGANRYSGDFIDAEFDSLGRPYLTWNRDTTGKVEVRFAGPRR